MQRQGQQSCCLALLALLRQGPLGQDGLLQLRPLRQEGQRAQRQQELLQLQERPELPEEPQLPPRPCWERSLGQRVVKAVGSLCCNLACWRTRVGPGAAGGGPTAATAPPGRRAKTLSFTNTRYA